MAVAISVWLCIFVFNTQLHDQFPPTLTFDLGISYGNVLLLTATITSLDFTFVGINQVHGESIVGLKPVLPVTW